MASTARAGGAWRTGRGRRTRAWGTWAAGAGWAGSTRGPWAGARAAAWSRTRPGPFYSPEKSTCSTPFHRTSKRLQDPIGEQTCWCCCCSQKKHCDVCVLSPVHGPFLHPCYWSFLYLCLLFFPLLSSLWVMVPFNQNSNQSANQLIIHLYLTEVLIILSILRSHFWINLSKK